jgi:hypothetical protein
MRKLLFRIIRRIRENARIEPALLAVVARYNDSMSVCVNKIMAEEYLPLRMKYFTGTVRREVIGRGFVSGIGKIKIFESI